MADESELDDLSNDFARLRESIAAELRRTGQSLPPAQQPARAAAETSQRVAATLGAPKPPVPAKPPHAKKSHAPTLAGGAAGDEELPSFMQLRESLLGSVVSGAPEPAAARAAAKPAADTVRISASPEKPRVPTSPGGLGASSADALSLSSEFESLRSSITQKLRGAAGEGLRAAEYNSVTLSRPDAASHASTLAHASAAGGTVLPVSADTVLLSARKPGAVGGPHLMTAASAAAASAASERAARAAAASAAAADAAHVDRAAALPSAPYGSAAMLQMEGAEVAELTGGSSELMFGHLAMEAALESHRRHYEAARSRLPAVAQYRPTPGVAPPPPPPARRPASGKPSAPKLSTASRARPSAETTSATLQAELETLGRSTARSKFAGRPTPSARKPPSVPLRKPAATADDARILPISGVGIAPSMETVRETERLVTELAAARASPAPKGPAYHGSAPAAGGDKPVRSVQQAWASSGEGAARQAEVIGSMAEHSASLYRTTMDQIAR